VAGHIGIRWLLCPNRTRGATRSLSSLAYGHDKRPRGSAGRAGACPLQPGSRSSWRRSGTIPEPFRPRLDEVADRRADQPTSDAAPEAGLGPDDGLYGLYEGVPRTGVRRRLGLRADKITLFAKPSWRTSRIPMSWSTRSGVTVIHELATTWD